MAVTFLTTEDAQAINTQLSNLVEAIAELNRQISQIQHFQTNSEEFQEVIHDLRQMKEEKSKERLQRYYESPRYKDKIIKEYTDSLIKQKK